MKSEDEFPLEEHSSSLYSLSHRQERMGAIGGDKSAGGLSFVSDNGSNLSDLKSSAWDIAGKDKRVKCCMQ